MSAAASTSSGGLQPPAGEDRAVSATYVVEYASFQRRFWAYWLDQVILGFVAIPIAMITGELFVAGFLMAFVIYQVGFTAEGGTPGKRMLGLRVTGLDGNRPGFGWVILRELIGKQISQIPVFLGYLWMLDDNQGRTWHDMMSKTYVVRERGFRQRPPFAEDPPWNRPASLVPDSGGSGRGGGAAPLHPSDRLVSPSTMPAGDAARSASRGVDLSRPKPPVAEDD